MPAYLLGAASKRQPKKSFGDLKVSQNPCIHPKGNSVAQFPLFLQFFPLKTQSVTNLSFQKVQLFLYHLYKLYNIPVNNIIDNVKKTDL